MEDNKQITQSTVTTDVDKNEVTVGRTFSQEEVNNLVGRTKKEEKQKSEQAIKEAVANALADYERKAKLTEEERAKEERSKYEKELKEKENQITLRERAIEAKEILATKNIPLGLVDFVVSLDEEEMKSNIDKLVKNYNLSVETGITEKLKGNPPKDFSTNKTETKKILTAF